MPIHRQRTLNPTGAGKDGEPYAQQAFAEFFPVEIGDITGRLDDFVAALRSGGGPDAAVVDRYNHYLSHYRCLRRSQPIHRIFREPAGLRIAICTHLRIMHTPWRYSLDVVLQLAEVGMQVCFTLPLRLLDRHTRAALCALPSSRHLAVASMLLHADRRDCLAETDVDKLEGLWCELDKRWMRVKHWIDIGECQV